MTVERIRPTDSTEEWRVDVGVCLKLQLWRTSWEHDFLRGLRDRKGPEISEKQRQILGRIYQRGEGR